MRHWAEFHGEWRKNWRRKQKLNEKRKEDSTLILYFDFSFLPVLFLYIFFSVAPFFIASVRSCFMLRLAFAKKQQQQRLQKSCQLAKVLHTYTRANTQTHVHIYISAHIHTYNIHLCHCAMLHCGRMGSFSRHKFVIWYSKFQLGLFFKFFFTYFSSLFPLM